MKLSKHFFRKQRKPQQLFDVSQRLKTTSEVVATILQAKVMRKAYILDEILIAGILHEPIKKNISILIAAHVFSPPANKKRAIWNDCMY
ncbi:uncharacterized protein LOC125550833 isoform X2 [Triticum urartu]|uniref:uncharacterized protein LOC125550833 isoform X2 n=1 Tax=Triticum urartu TaxID=4572 RepID=UPI002044A2C3|nr:uncharacterized protein LOC125550833 isoform X2 [Triticum urartu]